MNLPNTPRNKTAYIERHLDASLKTPIIELVLDAAASRMTFHELMGLVAKLNEAYKSVR